MLPETLVNEVIKQICKSLASFDLKTRAKGFKRLNQVIKLCNTGSYVLELEHCLLIWKGLHYWLWSQDKLLNQERLVDDICNLLPLIKYDKTKLDFISAFFQTEVREWRTLDKWRTDKFMKLMRQFFRQCLVWLSETEWKQLDAFLPLYKTMVSGEIADSAFSLRLHFASVYLEEVSRHAMNSELWMKFLTPYFDLVPHIPRDNPMLKRVEDIFFLILPPKEDDEEEEPLDIDFGVLGNLLFHLGGAGGKNVKKLYEWATICFDISGVSPPSDPLPQPSAAPDSLSKKKRKRKLNSAAVPEKPKVSPEETPSPPRKRPRIGEDESASPVGNGTRAKSPSPVGKKMKKGESPSPQARRGGLKAGKTPLANMTPEEVPVAAVGVPKPSPVKSAKTPENSFLMATPDTAGKDKRVSFGKIYRKPFKKKDAVKTPSPGTITSSAAGKGILKKKMFRQSKKKLAAFLIR